MTPVLWSISYSPWSEKARWALDACGVEHRRRPYQPLLDELMLRRRLGTWRGPVSVPILDLGTDVLADSFDIAKYADRCAGSDEQRILRSEDEDHIRRYDALSQRGLAAGRALGLARIVQDKEALAELVPRGIRRALGPIAVAISRFGVARTLRKYADVTPSDPHDALAEVLDTLEADLGRAEVGPHGTRHLLGRFSYADIAMAQVLAFVEPPSTHLRLSPASRRAYRQADLAERHPELVRWRDALYRAHRGEERPRRSATL